VEGRVEGDEREKGKKTNNEMRRGEVSKGDEYLFSRFHVKNFQANVQHPSHILSVLTCDVSVKLSNRDAKHGLRLWSFESGSWQVTVGKWVVGK
jgi:hypothetical protein